MYVGEKRITNENWEALSEVNTGEEFYIQNTSNYKLYYIVSDTTPNNNVRGGVISPYDQLSFKKVSCDLYIKKISNDGIIYIEKVEG